ncbi:hypothetical protein HQ602_18890 [Rhodococcus kroppenstedtii]|uniref:hypothetical protein n=1 Tax=Rhodococcoides kroppenstedtii TaxID=293050 RepID=UPI001C9B66DA|nr:hypothetical protein [Rhodococcus kroppenstedtii]MBY6438443.1 hypothetical protein [Rhodococcus kroppenstedtii]
MDHLTRQAALRLGLSDSSLHRAVAAGTMHRIRRGHVCDAADWEALTDDDRYLVRIRAAAAALTLPASLSHQSAAALHGLPILRPDRRVVHFSLDGRGGGHGGPRALHRCPLDPVDVTTVDGLSVTTLERTAVDVACAGTFAQAVCVAESALRAGATREEMDAALIRAGRRRGIAVARAGLAYADGRTESIGESWSRALMHPWGDVPEPRLQHPFTRDDGTFVARTDFDWNGRLVGEFDGEVKYGGDRRAAVLAERRRENALHALGVYVVRWTWPDLVHQERLHRLLRDGLRLVGLL